MKANNKNRLLLCPICGNPVILEDYTEGYSIYCEKCEIGQTNYYLTASAAIDAWNNLSRKERE